MKIIILSMFLLGTLLSANAQVPSYVPKDSLKGWYPFNGNADDLSGNGNNGTVNGASLTSDRFLNSNNAYDFNGTSNFISVNKAPFLNVPFSISVWVNIKSYNPAVGPVLGFGENGTSDGKKLYLSPDYSLTGTPSIGTAGANEITSSTNAISKNSWVNLVVTVSSYSVSGVKYYVNGILLGQNRTGGSNIPFPINNSGFSIGKHSLSSGTVYFNGKIDEIGIWNRVLSASEINDLYNGCNFAISTEPTNQSSNINAQAQFNVVLNDTTATYQWQMDLGTGFQNLTNAGQYSGAQNDTLLVANLTMQNNNQNFRCIVKSGSCMDTSKIAVLKVFDNVGLENINSELIKLYPNPSSTQVIIDNGNYSTMGSYTAKIVNSIGQQVFQSVINQQQFVIDAKTMGGAGVYTLYITDANNKVVGVKKIVLQ